MCHTVFDVRTKVRCSFKKSVDVPGNLAFAISISRLRERGRMSKSVYVRVFHDLELLRYVLRCAIEQQL